MWNFGVRGALHGAMLAGLIVVLIAGVPPAEAQTRSLSGVRVLAVAPFADLNPDTRRVAEAGGMRLGELLKRGRFQIVEPARVAEEMRRLGFAPSDLISPARTVALGQRLGADAVLTGRVVQITQDRSLSPGGREARVAIDVRILEVSSRLKLFEQELSCSDFSGSLTTAAECFARDAAALLLAP